MHEEYYEGGATIRRRLRDIRVTCSFTVQRNEQGATSWTGMVSSFEIVGPGRAKLRLRDGRSATILLSDLVDVSPFRLSFRGLGPPPT